MEKSRLYQALLNFKGADGDEKKLADEFNKIAQAAFYSGYFLINGGTDKEYRIELTCIEFYYHEDDGNIQDPTKHLKGEKEFNYPVGALLPHSSGVDVLFDNEEKKIHASFLIRGYVAIEKGETPYENNERSKTWNTQDFWYDFFGRANMLCSNRFNIEWIDNGESYDDREVYTMERIKNKKPFGDGRKWAYTKNQPPC